MENESLDKQSKISRYDMFFGNNLHFYDELLFRPLNRLNYHGVREGEWERTASTHTMPNDHLLEIEYSDNIHGYRSENFTGKHKLLILGCSQTVGHGMINEFTWPFLLSKKLNMDFARIASGGDSIQAQVSKAFEYFRVYGNPEIIVGTFPLYRLEFPYVKNHLERKDYADRNGKKIQQISIPGGDRPKYMKLPYDTAFTLPREAAIFYNFMFIKMLDQYCKSNNIKLIWNIWEDHEYFLFNYMNNNKDLNHILDNYYVGLQEPYNTLNVFEDINFECHQEYKDHILFYKAADVEPNGNSHWGMHKHIHVAEDFYEEIKRRFPDL